MCGNNWENTMILWYLDRKGNELGSGVHGALRWILAMLGISLPETPCSHIVYLDPKGPTFFGSPIYSPYISH